MMILSETDICNLALARIGAGSISDLTTDSSPQALLCRRFYASDRDYLLTSYWWTFAAGRASLGSSVATPAFEYDYSYALPSDFLALRTIWDENYTGGNLPYTCAIEGSFILSNESTVKIRYTKRIEDTSKFDALFVELLKIKLAVDLLYPLAKTTSVAAADRLQLELEQLSVRAKQMHQAQQNLIGRYERLTWLDARLTAGTVDPSRL